MKVQVSRSLARWVAHQRYLRFGIRNRIVGLLERLTLTDRQEFVVPFFGNSYRGTFESLLDKSVFYYGAYARNELQLFADLLTTLVDPVVFDVGANVGHHALFASRYSRVVYAFEPYEPVYQRMLALLAENGITHVKPWQLGLAECMDTRTFVPPPAFNTGMGSFVNAQGACSDRTIQLPVCSGDSFVEGHHIDAVHFLKLDIEGGERQALRGLNATLQRDRPIVFFEWSPPDDPATACEECARLFPEAYRFFEFRACPPQWLVFTKDGYRLQPARAVWRRGNMLALPEEYVARVRETMPDVNAARRIRGEYFSSALT